MSTIQTALRIKPLCKGEVLTNNMQIISDTKRIILGPKPFDFDYLLPASATQKSVYEQTCGPIIEGVLDGVKGSIIVYGQTGSGKTHTMFGTTPSEPDGIAYQSIRRMLEYAEPNQCVLTLSVLEVYMEKVTDLQSSKEVVVRKAFDPELVWTPVTNLTAAERIITTALESRHITSTNINDRSSRGHVIINVKLLRPRRTFECEDPDDASPIEESQLTLVDLAGSENVSRSKVQGRGMQEASSINRSLLALKKIILELSSTSTPMHISYRDSKLTLLLQDSIGGYSRTLLISCVSSAARDIEETRSSLEYSTKARQIRNLVQSEKERLSAKVKTLEFETQRLKNKFEALVVEKGNVNLSKAEYDDLIQCKEEHTQLTSELQQALKRISSQSNASQYLKVIQGVTDEREKAHTAELEAVRTQFAEHRRAMETIASAHFENTLKAISNVGRNLTVSETELRAGHESLHDRLKQRTVMAIMQECTDCATKASADLHRALRATGIKSRQKAQAMRSLDESAPANQVWDEAMDGLRKVMQCVQSLRGHQEAASSERVDAIHLLEDVAAQHDAVELPSTVNVQPIRDAIAGLHGSLQDSFCGVLQNQPPPDLRPIEQEANDFFDRTRIALTSISATEEKMNRDSLSQRGSTRQTLNRKSAAADLAVRRASSTSSSRGSADSIGGRNERPSELDRQRPKKIKRPNPSEK